MHLQQQSPKSHALFIVTALMTEEVNAAGLTVGMAGSTALRPAATTTAKEPRQHSCHR